MVYHSFMMSTILMVLASVIVVSLVSFVGVFSFSIHRKAMHKLLLFLVSLSAGSLFGGAFLHLLPEAVEKQGFTISVSLLVLAGIVLFFILEKIIHLHHHHHQGKEHSPLHEPHPHHIGILNLVGDGMHNFLDGLIIAASYLVDVSLGVATTLAVILHEVPQELADFGVLLYAGYSRGKALFFNFLSALVAVLGALVGLLVGSAGETFAGIIVPLAAGGFTYIAGSTLIPELHKHCKLKESFLHLGALVLGILLMVLLLFLE